MAAEYSSLSETSSTGATTGRFNPLACSTAYSRAWLYSSRWEACIQYSTYRPSRTGLALSG
ncbi:MAG: hypothetical protein AMJ81_02895 [Phycisphaerae bacterium SM23_33]|nr:MAG: hypothetical protein AMJ81_02895 [Phycisphaerae bacterium SM23_33]